MTGQKRVVIIGTICLILMIAATAICAIKYMKEEPAWNQEAAPIVTEAPDAARLDKLGQNRPPGDGVTPEQNDTPKGDKP